MPSCLSTAACHASRLFCGQHWVTCRQSSCHLFWQHYVQSLLCNPVFLCPLLVANDGLYWINKRICVPELICFLNACILCKVMPITVHWEHGEQIFVGHVMGVNPTKPLLNMPLSAGYSIRATIVSQFKPIFGHAILPLLVDILVS